MAKICLCLTGKTLGRNLEILEKNRNYLDLVELRVDCLEPDERFLIRRFPELAGVPVILTIRRDVDGGQYAGGEGARITLLSKALAFAEADRRRNFAYVDLEEDLNVPSLEEAARTFGTKIIRSYHNKQGIDADLVGKIYALRHVGDEIPKVAVTPRTIADVRRLYQAAWETKSFEKILLGMGGVGINTRILAWQMGSYLSYATAWGEPDMPSGGPGQPDVRDMAELYRLREMGPKTRLFAVTGFPLTVTGSPAFFNKVFAEENINAIYVPFPADSLEDFLALSAEIGLEGVSITVPYKERILSYLQNMSSEVTSVGACNTIVKNSLGWTGYNTDARGFSDSLLEFIGEKNLRGSKVTIIGAGGVARAVAFEVFRLKGRALILNRTTVRARELAIPYHFAWGGIDNQGMEQMYQFSDIIIQTTPVGMEGGVEADPVAEYKFYGQEKVMDLIYTPPRTPFLRRAEQAGCRVMNGYDMLLRQARYQYKYFMERDFPSTLMTRIQF